MGINYKCLICTMKIARTGSKNAKDCTGCHLPDDAMTSQLGGQAEATCSTSDKETVRVGASIAGEIRGLEPRKTNLGGEMALAVTPLNQAISALMISLSS